MFHYFLTYGIENSNKLSIISFIFDILHRITTFSKGHLGSSHWCKSDFISKILSSDITFNVVCELSQPGARQNFPALLKIEQTVS